MNRTQTFALWYDWTEKDNRLIDTIMEFIDEYINPLKVVEYITREKGRLYIQVRKESEDEKMLKMFLYGILGEVAL